MEEEPTVITLLPDEEYEDLYRKVKETKGRYAETLWPDKVETEMWISNGKLMSRMKGELLIKQILPNSQMPRSESSWEPSSGFSKSIQYIMDRDNLPFNLVSQMMMQLYKQYNIPKDVELPKTMLDKIHIAKVTEEELETME